MLGRVNRQVLLLLLAFQFHFFLFIVKLDRILFFVLFKLLRASRLALRAWRLALHLAKRTSKLMSDSRGMTTTAFCCDFE
jgi:hypothetical protein